MPTRRIFELMLVTVIAARPVFGLARLWATKTFMTKPRGTVMHGVAEIVAAAV